MLKSELNTDLPLWEGQADKRIVIKDLCFQVAGVILWAALWVALTLSFSDNTLALVILTAFFVLFIAQATYSIVKNSKYLDMKYVIYSTELRAVNEHRSIVEIPTQEELQKMVLQDNGTHFDLIWKPAVKGSHGTEKNSAIGFRYIKFCSNFPKVVQECFPRTIYEKSKKQL